MYHISNNNSHCTIVNRVGQEAHVWFRRYHNGRPVISCEVISGLVWTFRAQCNFYYLIA